MSLLAHHCRMAQGMEVERKELDKQIRFETTQAKRLQRELGCSWAEALRIAIPKRL